MCTRSQDLIQYQASQVNVDVGVYFWKCSLTGTCLCEKSMTETERGGETGDRNSSHACKMRSLFSGKSPVSRM